MLLGDREFCGCAFRVGEPDAKSAPSSSKHLATWLLEIGWGYCLRIKKSTYIHLNKQESVTLNQLASQPGISVFLRGVNITKTGHKFPFNVAAHYPKEHHGLPITEGWFLLLTLVYSTVILKSVSTLNSHHKYLARTSEPQRQYHRASMFTIGKIALLSCFDWDFIPGLIYRYIRLNRHKIDFYLRNLSLYNPYNIMV